MLFLGRGRLRGIQEFQAESSRRDSTTYASDRCLLPAQHLTLGVLIRNFNLEGRFKP